MAALSPCQQHQRPCCGRSLMVVAWSSSYSSSCSFVVFLERWRSCFRHSKAFLKLQSCKVSPPPLSWVNSRPEFASAVCASPQPVKHHEHQQQEQRAETLSAVATVVCGAFQAAVASSTFEFTQRIDPNKTKGLFSGPSQDFLDLCQEQLAICDKLFDHNARFTVFIRSAESYGTRNLELRPVAAYPNWTWQEQDENSILDCIFETSDLLWSAESALLDKEAVCLSELNALVLPMTKDCFLVGLLVVQLIAPEVESDSKHMKVRAVRPKWPPGLTNLQMQQVEEQRSAVTVKVDTNAAVKTFSQEQEVESKRVARSLAIVCVMDQRTLLLQQASWQRGVRIGDLLEKVRGPLTAIRTLGKMLQPQLKKGEISSDVLEDIIVQGERMKEVVQQFQEVGYFSQGSSNMLSNGENAMRIGGAMKSESTKAPKRIGAENLDVVVADNTVFKCEQAHRNPIISVGHSSQRDKETFMPPVALAPLKHSTSESCDVLKLLIDLVGTGAALAHKRGRALELKENTIGAPFLAGMDEPSLHQVFSNLLDSSLQHTLQGGWVKVEIMQAPGGGVLVVIDDNGLDLSLMSQAQALAPLGSGLQVGAHGKGNAKMALGIGAELIIAQNILEQFGGVLRITSPYLPKAPNGIGGTRFEVWLPAPLAEGYNSRLQHSQDETCQ